MVSAAFFHDHVFRIDRDGRVLSPGRLPYSAFRRYLQVFDKLVVVGRSITVGVDTAGLVLSTGPNVVFRLDHGYRGPVDLLRRRVHIRCEVASIVEAADVVIARVPSELGLLGASIAQSRGKTLAVEVVACARQSYSSHGAYLGKIYGPWIARRTRMAVADAQYAIYVTERHLQALYPSRGLAASASNVELLPRFDSFLRYRLERLRATRSEAVLGFVGSLQGRHKGLDLALRATAQLVRSGMAVRLECAGDGPCEPWMNLVHSLDLKNNVHFLGALPGSAAVQNWMQGIDCLLHPSRAEGLPRAVIEAMWVGCPVVASSAGGTIELLEKSSLCSVGDYRCLAERAMTALSNSRVAEHWVKRNWEEAARFSSECVVASRSRFWSRVAEDHAVRRKKD